MSRYWRCSGSLVAVVLLAVLFGCGGKKAKQEAETTAAAAPAVPKGPDYQEFAPLPRATSAAQLPFLIDAKGPVATACFKPAEGLAPEEAGYDYKRLVEENAAAVADAVKAWLVEDVAVDGLAAAQAASWEITPSDLVVLTVPPAGVRFTDDQECIDKKRGWLPEGVRAATALIGAKSFSFTTQLPVGYDLSQEMIKAVGLKGVVMESAALFVYEPALDANNEPLKDDKGVVMYKSPTGVNIPETEVPPPEKRTMKDWTLKSEAPIFFAFRELPNDGWRKENKKDNCDVFLVWGDVTPRPPECEEFKESSFTATKTEDNQVSITVTTSGENKGVILPYGKAKVVQVSDRVILWISPQPIEEGVKLKLDSLVLGPAGGGDASYTKPAAEPEEKAAPAEEVPLAKQKGKKPAAADEEKPKKDKEKAKDKGKKKSDTEALDDFLQ